MSYFKLIPILLVNVLIVSCGTDSSPKKLSANWQYIGLVDHKINALDNTESALVVAGEYSIFRRALSSAINEEWHEIGFEIDTETSVFGDILDTDKGLFTVVRNVTDYHELPVNYTSLYKSVDGGTNWNPIEITLEGREKPYVINRIAKNETSLFADWHLVFKSSDGIEWGNLSKETFVGISEFLYVSDNHPNQIWTGGWTSIFSPYLAKSEDGGDSWVNLNEEIFYNAEAVVNAVVIHPEKEQTVLAGVGNVIRKSTNGGETWEHVLSGYAIWGLKNSHVKPDRVYASGVSPSGQLFVAISDDYGDSWKVETYKNSPGDIQTNDMIVTNINGSETLFFGTSKGVYSLRFEE